MMCNFPSPFSVFCSKNDIYDSAQRPEKLSKKFQLGLKNVKIFYIW